MKMFDWLNWLTRDNDTVSRLARLPPKELLDAFSDPQMVYNLQLARERGELGVLSRRTRDIDLRTASMDDLEVALSECRLWRATYPETDDYALVSWLEAVIADEIMIRAISKIAGGTRVTKLEGAYAMMTKIELEKQWHALDALTSAVAHWHRMQTLTAMTMYFSGSTSRNASDADVKETRDALTKQAAALVGIRADMLRALNVDPTSELPEELR